MIRIEFPLLLPSTSNLREHWATRAKRVKAQRKVTGLVLRAGRLRAALNGREPSRWSKYDGVVVAITLTRVAPRKLDDDNLRGALKAVRDEVAFYFGVDDADPRIEWRYGQAKGKAACRIELETEPMEALCIR